MALNNRQKVFVSEYLICWNATRAYLKAYPNSTYDSARSSSTNLLAKPSIKAEIDKRLSENAMSANEVIARLAEQARSSHAPFIRITDDGFVYFDFSNPDALNNLHLIKKIKTKRERRIEGSGEQAEEWEGEWIEVELHDAQAALVQLGRHHGLFTDKQDITSGGGKISAEFTDEERALRIAAILKSKTKE